MWRTNFAPAGLRGRVIFGKGNRMDNNELSTDLAEVGTDAISRQAAIKDAESWVAVDEYEKHLKKIVIEWLKEFPPAELGTDCISRQAAIDAINEYMVGKRCDTDGTMMARLINELVIKQLPSIQPKSGRWIHDGSKWTNRWICSECGYKWFFDCIEGAYCPNCGAKMEVTT